MRDAASTHAGPRLARAPAHRHQTACQRTLSIAWAQTMSDPHLAEDMGGRFDHVLVDEYQDTNRLQASILLALKPEGRGLTVVGGR
jgi:hypothetical protein